jgi:deoxyribodipyrimidine photo-lyase
MSTIAFWFRRDLRLKDNHGLWQALKSGKPVIPVFIFDRHILDLLEDKDDRRVSFIHNTLFALDAELRAMGSGLLVAYGHPETVWQQWIQKYNISDVYTNHDYEPYALQRDESLRTILASQDCKLHTYKDQVIFERDEIVKDDGKPYTVFTPYKNKWLKAFEEKMTKSYPSESLGIHFHKMAYPSIPTLQAMGFAQAEDMVPPRVISTSVIGSYDQTRDYPAVQGTSRLSVHLRFGTLSVRQAVATGRKLNSTWLNELIWREFYMMILWHFPHVARASFKPQYDMIPWENNPEYFKAWSEGKTGYPIVDAGMRELKETGFMHNRVRMVTASFLTKHLLCDWRLGEAWFARHLLDFDVSANNGGWQWAAGSGCDAAPYFRVFSPQAQQDKFDAKGEYIRKWVPEWGTSKYVKPIVDHATARIKAIETYKKALRSE